MSSDYINREEFERYQRFHQEQFNTVGVQIVELRGKLESVQPNTPVAPGTKDLLLKQVDKMFKDLQFLQFEVMRLKSELERVKKTGVPEGVK